MRFKESAIIPVGSSLAMYTLDVAEVNVQRLALTIRWADSSSTTKGNKIKVTTEQPSRPVPDRIHPIYVII